MSPDPDFVAFFAKQFQRELEAIEVPGMADASWDRKAAWLLFEARRERPVQPEPAPVAISGGGIFD